LNSLNFRLTVLPEASSAWPGSIKKRDSANASYANSVFATSNLCYNFMLWFDQAIKYGNIP
jgi:hypothetical protein